MTCSLRTIVFGALTCTLSCAGSPTGKAGYTPGQQELSDALSGNPSESVQQAADALDAALDPSELAYLANLDWAQVGAQELERDPVIRKAISVVATGDASAAKDESTGVSCTLGESCAEEAKHDCNDVWKKHLGTDIVKCVLSDIAFTTCVAAVIAQHNSDTNNCIFNGTDPKSATDTQSAGEVTDLLSLVESCQDGADAYADPESAAAEGLATGLLSMQWQLADGAPAGLCMVGLLAADGTEGLTGPMVSNCGDFAQGDCYNGDCMTTIGMSWSLQEVGDGLYHLQADGSDLCVGAGGAVDAGAYVMMQSCVGSRFGDLLQFTPQPADDGSYALEIAGSGGLCLGAPVEDGGVSPGSGVYSMLLQCDEDQYWSYERKLWMPVLIGV